MDERNAVYQRDYKLSISIGFIYKDPGVTISIDELMYKADALMYEQKRRKRKR
jgi:hypothetical protein